MHAVTPIEREPAPKAMLRHRARMRLAALAWRFHLQERGDLFRGGPSEEAMAGAAGAVPGGVCVWRGWRGGGGGGGGGGGWVGVFFAGAGAEDWGGSLGGG